MFFVNEGFSLFRLYITRRRKVILDSIWRAACALKKNIYIKDSAVIDWKISHEKRLQSLWKHQVSSDEDGWQHLWRFVVLNVLVWEAGGLAEDGPQMRFHPSEAGTSLAPGFSRGRVRSQRPGCRPKWACGAASPRRWAPQQQGRISFRWGLELLGL